MAFVEEGDHQVFPFQCQQYEGHSADDGKLQRVGWCDGKHVAENDGLNVYAGGGQRHHEQAKAKKGREDQPDDGVFLQLGFLVEKQHGACRESACEKGAQRKGEAQHVGPGDAGYDGMGQGIADQRPALEHEIGGKECADATHESTDPHGVDHVGIGERLEQAIHGCLPVRRRWIALLRRRSRRGVRRR